MKKMKFKLQCVAFITEKEHPREWKITVALQKITQNIGPVNDVISL